MRPRIPPLRLFASEIARKLLSNCSGVALRAAILLVLLLLLGFFQPWSCSETALALLSVQEFCFCRLILLCFAGILVGVLQLLWNCSESTAGNEIIEDSPLESLFFRFNCSETALKVLWVLLRILCYCSFFFLTTFQRLLGYRSETTLKLRQVLSLKILCCHSFPLYNCSETTLKLLWSCSEITLEPLWMSSGRCATGILRVPVLVFLLGALKWLWNRSGTTLNGFWKMFHWDSLRFLLGYLLATLKVLWKCS